ncbi:MAG: hypothetical protein KAW56_16550 [Candidatus Marinimicrobia bacterium]|nr:hypothetical protein [Candidatus Neomarinimicrobiota bacterium]
MILGQVCGAIHSTINHEFYDSKKLLLVDRLNIEVKPSGKCLIAVDSVGAGAAGETVLVIDEGNSARLIVEDDKAPIRSIIIGIVDQLSTE